MDLKNLTWEEAHWLRCAILIASRHTAKGSIAWRSYASIVEKLASAEDEAMQAGAGDRPGDIEINPPTVLQSEMEGDRS